MELLDHPSSAGEEMDDTWGGGMNQLRAKTGEKCPYAETHRGEWGALGNAQDQKRPTALNLKRNIQTIRLREDKECLGYSTGEGQGQIPTTAREETLRYTVWLVMEYPP